MLRHRFDPVSFVFGVVFLAVAGFAVSRESIDPDITQWVWPVVLLVLGTGLLASMFWTSRDNREEEA